MVIKWLIRRGLAIARKEKRKAKEKIIIMEPIPIPRRGLVSGRKGFDDGREADGIDGEGF